MFICNFIFLVKYMLFLLIVCNVFVPSIIELNISLLAVTFVIASGLDPDKDRQKVGSDLNPNRLTL